MFVPASVVKAIAELEQAVDTLIVVNNDQLLKIIPADTPVEHAFKVADDVLRQVTPSIRTSLSDVRETHKGTARRVRMDRWLLQTSPLPFRVRCGAVWR